MVTIDDVLFRKDGETIPTDDRELMALADTVSITFRKQKNRDNGTTITHHRNDRPGQSDICPVRTLVDLVSRIRGYGQKPENANLGINAWAETTEDESKYLSSTTVLEQLRTATRALGERCHCITCHCICQQNYPAILCCVVLATIRYIIAGSSIS